MTAKTPRAAVLPTRCISALLFSVLMASCTATPNDPTLGLAASPTLDQPMAPTSSLAGEQDAFIQSTTAPADDKRVEIETNLPAEVAFAPNASPSREPIAALGQMENGAPSLATATLTIPDPQRTAQVAQQPAPKAEAPQQAVAAATPASTLPGTVIENRVGGAHQASESAATRPAAVAATQEPAAKAGFLSAFMAPNKANAAPAPIRAAAKTPLIAQKEGKSLLAESNGKPLVQLASVSPEEGSKGTARGSDAALPGVRTSALFEITRKSGIDDDSDVDLHEGGESPVRVASAAGMARLAPNGLLKQTPDVDVSCLKPALLRVLQTVEKHYGKKAVISSGYRDPARNKRARGARNSLHMYCAAADVQIEGVSKWELATFVRSMPGRGGVGTYCHTDSVHIDVGPERDWNWRCRRKNS